jgi:hypothetical protein
MLFYLYTEERIHSNEIETEQPLQSLSRTFAAVPLGIALQSGTVSSLEDIQAVRDKDYSDEYHFYSWQLRRLRPDLKVIEIESPRIVLAVPNSYEDTNMVAHGFKAIIERSQDKEVVERQKKFLSPCKVETPYKKDHKAPKVIKILFLSANPIYTDRLRIDEEMREIDQVLRQAEFRERFDIKQHWAVRVIDLQSLLLRHKPDIVHFSGHGSKRNEIILEDNFGIGHRVSVRALSRLFYLLRDNIRCVLLNACYSKRQATAIAKHIECVVGMSGAVGDKAAIKFATAFYQALGYGRDVKTAFDLGCVQIDLENLNDYDKPNLIAKKINPKDIIFVW